MVNSLSLPEALRSTAAAERGCWRPRATHGIQLNLSHVPAAALAISSTLGLTAGGPRHPQAPDMKKAAWRAIQAGRYFSHVMMARSQLGRRDAKARTE